MKQTIDVVPLYASKRPRRTPLKRKVGSSIKRASTKLRKATKRRKNGKTEIRKLKDQLWELCKQIIRKQYGNTCYTCEKENLSGSSWQTGHFYARSICGVYLKYDLRNLRPQCYRCNIDLSGNGAVFYRKLVAIEGQRYVDQIFADKERLTKLTPAFLSQKIAEYKSILQKLTETKL